MKRWKVKTGLTDGNKGDREITLVFALYDEDKPVQRHVASFPETATTEDVIKALRDLTDEI
jgi:hypothetical protein